MVYSMWMSGLVGVERGSGGGGNSKLRFFKLERLVVICELT